MLTARDVAKGETVAEGIRKSTGNAGVEVAELELGSLASIRAFAERFLARHAALQILVDNAGVMACPFGKTTDGFEQQFGANHLGHVLMTVLIAPALLRGAPARIVSVSARGVHANALHPGVIMTELSRHMQREDFETLRQRAAPRGGLKMKTIPAGAATSVYAATAPELEGRGGLYLEDCHVAEIDDSATATSGVRSYALDAEAAKRLWTISERAVGITGMRGL